MNKNDNRPSEPVVIDAKGFSVVDEVDSKNPFFSIPEVSDDATSKLTQFNPSAPAEKESGKTETEKDDAEASKELKHKKKDKKNKDDAVGKKANSKSLKTVRSTQIFSPIRSVRDGIIVTKNGDFVKLMEFSPINFMLRGTDEQKIIINRFASIIKYLPKHFQFKIVSTRADATEYIDKIRQHMATETNENTRQLQWEQIQLISQVSNTEAVSRRFFLAFKYSQPANTHPSFNEISDTLETIGVRISGVMSNIGNRQLSVDGDNDYTMSALYNMFARNKSMKMPYVDRIKEVYLRHAVTSENDEMGYVMANDIICPDVIDTRNRKYIVIDGLYYAFVYIPSKSYPTSLIPGWINIFSNLGEGIDVDLYGEKQDIASIQRRLLFGLRAQKISAKNTEDTSMDYDEKIKIVQSGYYLKEGIASGQDFIMMSTLITVTAEDIDTLDSRMQELKEYCISIGMPIKACSFQNTDALLSSLPICSLEPTLKNKMHRNILGDDFACAYPFSSYELSNPDGVMFGVNQSNRTLVIVDNFDSKLYANANMSILGTSGAGKTFTMQCLALRMREKDIQTFILAPDKGHEFKRACDAIGGSYIKIAPGSAQNINIMELRPVDSSVTNALDGGDIAESYLIKKIQQLHVFFSILIPNMTGEEDQLLDEALVRTYAKFGITDDNESLWDDNHIGYYKKMPILGDLHAELENVPNATRLYTILTRFVKGSASSFNAPTNVNLDNKYIVLDVSSLTKDMLPIGMFIALDYVWDKARENRTKKKAIFVDEVWQLIGTGGSEQSAEFVVEIFKVIRGYGGAAIAATQDLNDFFAMNDGQYGKAIINNSKIKIIMKLETSEARRVQKELELNENETERCMNFDRGQGLVVANSNRVVVNFVPSRHEQELITTDREELRRLAESRARAESMATYIRNQQAAAEMSADEEEEA